MFARLLKHRSLCSTASRREPADRRPGRRAGGFACKNPGRTCPSFTVISVSPTLYGTSFLRHPVLSSLSSDYIIAVNAPMG